MAETDDIDPAVPPSGPGCVECLATDDGWWFHLRRCAKCGHIGCCDSSPSQHASRHAGTEGHPIVQSFEPGEDWFWDYTTEQLFEGPVIRRPRYLISNNINRILDEGRMDDVVRLYEDKPVVYFDGDLVAAVFLSRHHSHQAVELTS